MPARGHSFVALLIFVYFFPFKSLTIKGCSLPPGLTAHRETEKRTTIWSKSVVKKAHYQAKPKSVMKNRIVKAGAAL